MKILYTSSLDIRKQGSDKTHFIEVAQGLVELGHQILVLVPGYQPLQNTDFRLDIRFVPTLAKSRIAYLWAEFLRVPYFVHVAFTFRPNAVYARQGLFDLVLPLVARILRIPYISEVNGIAEDEFRFRGANEILVKILGAATFLSLRFSTQVICVTSGLAKEISKRYGVSSSRIVVVSNGANTDMFKPMNKTQCRAKLDLGQGFYVGFIGAFAPWQGLTTLLEAAEVVNQQGPSSIKYLLVGSGEQEPLLRELVKKYSLDQKVIFAGRVPYSQVVSYINAFDIAVAPFSQTRNATIGLSPLKLYEYLASGCPVIASRIGGVREIIEGSQSGFLSTPDDAHDLAQKIIQAYHERDSLDAMGKRGRMLILEKYSWRETARQVAAVLSDAITNHGSEN